MCVIFFFFFQGQSVEMGDIILWGCSFRAGDIWICFLSADDGDEEVGFVHRDVHGGVGWDAAGVGLFRIEHGIHNGICYY
jgi:hypothetical protein